MSVTNYESFVPLSHHAPSSLVKKIIFIFRQVLDLQLFTIYRDAKSCLPEFHGRILDVGCGNSPFQHLLPKNSIYTGLDIDKSDHFSYKNSNIVTYNGDLIPFADETFDGIICTEVLEHIFEQQSFVKEIHRVMKPNGSAFITIPWSAREHYLPFDYFRVTSSGLMRMFSCFSSVDITARGGDVASIISKIIALWFRCIFFRSLKNIFVFPLMLAITPFIMMLALLAHVCLFFKIGSPNDPLGYTIKLRR